MIIESKRLTGVLAAFACVLLAIANQCAAQNFPSRPIRFIVPWQGGGAPDFLARLVGKKLTESLGQPVLVEDRPGASGIIGAEIVARAPA
ncbi:MAG: tripartite tricarboxylate transporter substrate-binding protein, partial [Gallionella sp.]|nr:tripartite tricarboxylate transporter substrate-binding protein [Gallionella sp.]